MIHEDKVKTMTKLAIYEKKKSKRDFKICSYEERDYVHARALKNGILITIACMILGGILLIGAMDILFDSLDQLNYMAILAVTLLLYFIVLFGYTIISHRQSAREYAEAQPRMKEYADGLEKMEEFYREEERQQKKFEKGQWQHGQ